MDRTTWIVATPTERKRVTIEPGFAFPYILIETWDDRGWINSDGTESPGSWIVTSHVPIMNLPVSSVIKCVEDTIDKYLMALTCGSKESLSFPAQLG